MKREHLIAAAVVLMVLLVAGGELLRAHRANLVVSEWQLRVESTLSASSTPENAKEQLESLGFEVVRWNPQDPRGWIGARESGSSAHPHRSRVVMGFKSNETRWPLRTEPWIKAVVQFELAEAYQHSEVSLCPIGIGKKDR